MGKFSLDSNEYALLIIPKLKWKASFWQGLSSLQLQLPFFFKKKLFLLLLHFSYYRSVSLCLILCAQCILNTKRKGKLGPE